MSDRPPEVEQLIEKLRSDGDSVDEGEFTLDRRVARERLQQYQLTDPHTYVLKLVQAVVLKGATFVDFSIDTNDMWLRCNGRPFTVAELDRVYEAAFRHKNDPDSKALSQLAFGINAAQGLSPRWFRLVSGAPGRYNALEIRRGRKDRIGPTDRTPDDVPDKTQVVTEIHVRARWTFALMQRFFENVARCLPEERALRRGCQYASIDITLDGRPIFDGLELPTALATAPIAGPGFGGIAGVLPGPDPPQVRWVVNHVFVATHRLSSKEDEGFVAVVGVAGLREDLSQRDVVRDKRYEEVLAEVQRVRKTLRKDHQARKEQHDVRYEKTKREVDRFYLRPSVLLTICTILAGICGPAGLALMCIGALGMIALFFEKWLGDWVWLLLFAPEVLGAVLLVIAYLCNLAAGRIFRRSRRRFLQRYPLSDPMHPIAIEALKTHRFGQEGKLARTMLHKLISARRSILPPFP